MPKALARAATAFRDYFLVGNIVDDYILNDVLGAGMFGTCFRGRSLEDESPDIVFKLIASGDNSNKKEDVWTEAAALSLCYDPLAPRTPEWLGIARDRHGRRYMKQSLLEGISLSRALFKEWRSFSLEEILSIGEQLIDILAHIHSKGVLHNDVRPSNILISDSKIALVDFGMASFFDRNLQQEVFISDAVTDRSGLADTLLFLLYSDNARIHKNMSGSWHNELAIPGEQKKFLAFLFEDECCYRDWNEVRARFTEAFTPPLSQ